MTNDRACEILDPEHREHYDSIDPVNEACRMAISALRAREWISVEDRLPENGIDVLLYWSNDAQNEKYVDMERYHIDHWETLDRPWIRAIAWMPLPEPPKEVQM